jgi:hypothetical protein
MFTLGTTLYWRTPLFWPDLLAGLPQGRRPAAYVLRMLCMTCGQRWLGEAPLLQPQSCPACGGTLECIGAWDLREAYPWWTAGQIGQPGKGRP